jgi:hypothetical protein
MTSRDLTIAAYVLIALVGVALQAASYGRRSRIPSLSTLFRRVMRTRSGRLGVVAGWAWLGLHFFAR